MTFGATSDLHGILPKVDKSCDVFLICGDISPLNIQSDYYRMEHWMRSTFAQWVNNLPCDQVVMTPGNHDFYLYQIMGVEPNIYESITRPTKGKLEVLYNKETNVISKDGEVCKIFGTPWCNIFGSWPFMKDSTTLKGEFAEIPKGCDIVISHAAPKVGDYGKVLQDKPHRECGCKELADELKIKQPKVSLSGHIHSGKHELGKHKGYGDTLFANVSYLDESYIPAYDILYFSL